MGCDLANMLRNAAECIDEERDFGAYQFTVQEVVRHIEELRRGEHTLDEFADFYMLRPRAPAPAVPSTAPGAGEPLGHEGGEG